MTGVWPSVATPDVTWMDSPVSWGAEWTAPGGVLLQAVARDGEERRPIRLHMRGPVTGEWGYLGNVRDPETLETTYVSTRDGFREAVLALAAVI